MYVNLAGRLILVANSVFFVWVAVRAWRACWPSPVSSWQGQRAF